MFDLVENWKDFNAVLLKEKLDMACQEEGLSRSAFFKTHQLTLSHKTIYNYLYKGQMPEHYLDEFIRVLSLTNNQDIFIHKKLPKGILTPSIIEKDSEKSPEEFTEGHRNASHNDIFTHLLHLIQIGSLDNVSFSYMGVKCSLEKE